MTDLILREYEGFTIPIRPVDRYVHATAMAKAFGKKWNDYWRLNSTKEYLAALSKRFGMPVSFEENAKAGFPALGEGKPGISSAYLIESRKGGNDLEATGTWIHELVAIDFARWLSPDFSVQMAVWMRELLTTGKVELESQPVIPFDYDQFRLLIRDELSKQKSDPIAEQGRPFGDLFSISREITNHLGGGREWAPGRRQIRKEVVDELRRCGNHPMIPMAGWDNADWGIYQSHFGILTRAVNRYLARRQEDRKHPLFNKEEARQRKTG